MKRIKEFFLEHSSAIFGYFVGFFIGLAFSYFIMTAATKLVIEKYTAKQEYQSVFENVSDKTITNQ